MRWTRIFAEIAVIYGKFICISPIDCKMFAHSTSVSIRNPHTTLIPCYGTSGATSSRPDEDDDRHRSTA
ncbi:MAG: hypothetical protein DME60_05605 [Verrucomicrobia bacterium]|nr:MAG: hypothetical protein DME60_05605 [Verrucomicrobiota bacterium]